MRLLLILAFVCALRAESLEATGRDIFRACHGCHNVLTDARRAGPSLRTLYGKVRLVNGKRTNDDNVIALITEGYNNMPSYKNLLRPAEWQALIAYLRTLRARPEIGATLRPIRGSDEDVLAVGKKLYVAHCVSCHAEKLVQISELGVVRRVREGHNGMPLGGEAFDDTALFSLLAYLKTY